MKYFKVIKNKIKSLRKNWILSGVLSGCSRQKQHNELEVSNLLLRKAVFLRFLEQILVLGDFSEGVFFSNLVPEIKFNLLFSETIL